MSVVSTAPPLPGATLVSQVNTGFLNTPQSVGAAFARDISLPSGTQSIVTGFRPKIVYVQMNINATNVLSFGFAPPTGGGSGAYDSQSSAGTGSLWSALVSGCIFASPYVTYNPPGGTYFGAISMDATGFTITWTRGATPSALVMIVQYFAYGSLA